MEQWAHEYPGLDVSAWAITLRIGRIADFIHYNARSYEQYGLNRYGVETLIALLRSPKQRLSPSQLSDTLLASSATMTSRLDRLQSEGLITRRHDRVDRRSIVVQLTPKGRELADRILKDVLARRNKQVEALTEEEKTTLSSLLRKLLMSLESQAAAENKPAGKTLKLRRAAEEAQSHTQTPVG
jgi:DNA-binding MarR family transcriptional regulator